MKHLLFFAISFLIVSCGSSLETTTVNSDPAELLDNDTTTATSEDEIDDFIHLKLGEIAPVYSLDPLFAESNSELRTNNLVYEQLIGLNQLGNPAPELANSWEVNADSTQFTLHLRTDIYYYDSSVFSSGSGRRITAKDVRFIFERMADNKVPDFAANMFDDIRGFNAYHNEQTLIKDPEKRVLENIEGLRIQNDSTLVFYLKNSSSDFLMRLAHPYASVYPEESVPETGPIVRAAGTGRFKFIQKNDNTLLFAINENYRGVTPDLNRLDIVSGLDERDLYQEFARKNLDALVEVSIPTLRTITDPPGSLIDQFNPIYRLENTGITTTYTVFYNRVSDQSNSVNTLLDSLDAGRLIGNEAWGNVQFYPLENTSVNTEDRQLAATHLQNHNERMLFNNLASASASLGFSFSVSPSFAPSSTTTFTTLPYADTTPVIRWEAPVFILSHRNIQGIRLQNYAWEMNLTSVEVSEDS